MIQNRIIVYLDGWEAPPNEIEGWDGTITVTRRGTDVIASQQGGYASVASPSVSYSGTMTFYGEAAALIRARLLGPDGQNNAVKVELYNTCCGTTTFVGEIRNDGLSYCDGDAGDGCGISATIADASPEAAAVALLKNKVIKGFDAANPQPTFYLIRHPFVRHCNALRPKALAVVLIIVAFGINTLFGYMVPIVAIVSILVSLVPFAPSFGAPLDLLNAYLDFIDTLEQSVIGCGQGYQSPFVTSYLDQITTLTGLTWQSSLFKQIDASGNDIAPFARAMWWQAPNGEGTRDYLNPDGTVIFEVAEAYWQLNAPSETCYEWLDILCKSVGARWWMEGRNIRIENLVPTIATTFDLRDLPSNQISNGPCYDLTGRKAPAFARLKFADDFDDQISKEVSGNWTNASDKAYFDAIVDFNTPPQPGREGPINITLPIGRAGFRNDEFMPDELAPFAGLPFIANSIGNSRHWLKLSNGKASQPKLLVWNGLDIIEAQVERVDVGGGKWQYNNTFKFRPSEPNSLWALGGFRYLVERNAGKKAGQTLRVTVAATCDTLRNLSVGGAIVDLGGDTATITSYTIASDSITIQAEF